MSRLLSMKESIERNDEVFRLFEGEIVPDLYTGVEVLDHWIKSPSRLVRALADDQDKLRSVFVVWVVYRADYERFARGELKEAQLRPFDPADGGRVPCVLYLAGIIAQRTHDLIRMSYGLLKDLEWYHKETACHFESVFAFAQDRRSELLCRKLGLKPVGHNSGHAVLAADRKALPLLDRLLP